MRNGLGILMAVLLAPAGAAQWCPQPSWSEFGGSSFFDNLQSGSVMFAIQTSSPTAIGIERVEMFTGENTRKSTVSIWTHDPTTRLPMQQLGSGSWTINRTNGWQGAILDKTVSMAANTIFWVVWGAPSGSQMSITTYGTPGPPGAQVTAVSTNGGSSWSSMGRYYVWKFRLYCCRRALATHVPYGSGCASSTGSVPQIGSAGVPLLGTTFDITLRGAPAFVPAIFALGMDDQTWGPVRLPFALAGLGAPGCSVLCAYEIIAGASTDAQGHARHALTIPNNPSMVAAAFYDQWVIVDGAANRLGMVLSDGGKGTIGSY